MSQTDCLKVLSLSERTQCLVVDCSDLEHLHTVDLPDHTKGHLLSMYDAPKFAVSAALKSAIYAAVSLHY